MSGYWLDITTPIVLTVVGVVVFLAGTTLLLRFVRKYSSINSSG
ncbi:MAG TPA: hypothetical protein VM537_31610 [Anaerolineae bacterium]|jgi:hypothetical protein|nr:hypothetical protein [Anaerolineae bacterium]